MFSVIHHVHQLALAKSQEGYDSVNNLILEGKVSFGKNLRIFEDALKVLRGEFLKHIRVEEEVVFPFLTTRIPRMDPILRFLSAEHKEIKTKIKDIEKKLSKIKSEKNNVEKIQPLIIELKEDFRYYYCLLQNHIKTEMRDVYSELGSALKDAELKLLQKKIFRMQKT